MHARLWHSWLSGQDAAEGRPSCTEISAEISVHLSQTVNAPSALPSRTSQRPLRHSSMACFSEMAGSLMWKGDVRVRPT